MPISGPAIRTKEFLENLIDAVREPLVVLDQDLRVLSVSRAFYEVFQVKPRETIGHLIYDLGNRQWDIPKLRELLETILPQHTSFKDYEVVHNFSGIGLRVMLLNARQIKRALGKRQIILLAIEDITDRQALAVLKIAEDDAREFAQSIIDTIREPLIVLDHDLRIVAASRAFYEVFHVKPEETIGQLIFDLGNGQWNIPKLRELLDILLLQATTFNDYEVVHDFSNIGRRTMLLNARQVKRRQGKERMILLAIEDVTDRKRMEAELLKNQRVESLGVLAGGIAHDFNNLMAGLMTNTELARLHLQSGRLEGALERLDKTPPIFFQGRELTRRLLTFSKGGVPVRSPIALGPFLREWSDFALIGSDLTSRLEVDEDLWTCECDVGQIGQAINNLLINARQASPEGGEVTLYASNVVKLGKCVEIKITNQGPPIPPEILGRIFDPFFTTKSEGSGLGLAIVFSIVRQHGGSIDVCSIEGQGTTFSLCLPASTGGVFVQHTVGDKDTFHGSGTALVMDDNEDILDAVGQMLVAIGFEVIRVKSGQEALQAYQLTLQKGQQIGAYLLDNQIPGGMGGLATAERLRVLGAQGQIILMSGFFDAIPGHVAAKADGLWRLAKPFTKEELFHVLSA